MTFLLAFVVYAIALSWMLGRQGIRGTRSGHAFANPGRTGTPPTRVLIVGATGGTGRALVAQALERGHLVTAFVRDPAALPLEHPRLRILRGNVLDYASLAPAVRDQDAVLSALGHKQFFRPTRILSEGTRNVLAAMDAQGVRRLVCETALGIGDSAGRMGLWYTLFVIPAVLPFYFWDKTRQERLIERSSVTWTVVRPGALTGGPRRGRYRHGRQVGSLVTTVRISRADVAEFMLDQIADPAYVGAAPGVSW